MANKSYSGRKCLCYLITFLVLYQPALFSFNILHLLSVVSIIYLYRNRKEILGYLASTYLFFVGMNVVYLMYIAVVAIRSGTIMFGLYSAFLYIVELQLCAFFVFVLCKKSQVLLKDALITAGLMQAVLALIAMILPPVQNAIINLYVRNGFPIETTWFAGKRFFGMSAQLTFTMPVVQTILGVWCLKDLNYKENTVKKILCAGVLFLSALINARITIVVLAIGAVYLVIRHRHYLKTLPRRYYLIAACALAVCVFLVWIISPVTFSWIFQGVADIFSLFTGSEVDGSYFETLFGEFIFFPERISELLLGTGINIFSGSILERRSDVGYIIDLWYAGLVGCVLKYIPCVISLWKSGKYDHFAYFLLAVVAVVNVKGIAVENNELMAFITLFLLYEGSKHKIHSNKAGLL